MPKRLFWMSAGYAGGAASSWWVQRKVKREVERVLPDLMKSEVTKRVTEASDRAIDRTVHSPVGRGASKAIKKVRPDIDLTERAEAHIASHQPQPVVLREDELGSEPGIGRLRERSRTVQRWGPRN